jgi:hypothetical protein
MGALAVLVGSLAFFWGAGSPASTDLTITAWQSAGTTPKVWTLRCDPASGTLPKPQRACGRLAALTAPIAPVRRGVLCSQVYGGPQLARVRGTYRGAKVNAFFKQTDGCQTARWHRVSFLFPIFSGTLPPPR